MKKEKLTTIKKSLCLFMGIYIISTTGLNAQIFYGPNQINLQLRSYFGNLSKPANHAKYNHCMSSHIVDSVFYLSRHNDTINNSIFYEMQREMKFMAYDTLNITSSDTTFKYANRFSADTVQLGIIDFNYYRIKPVALSTNLYFNFDTINNSLTDLNFRPGFPYDLYNCCVLSPLVSDVTNANVVYRIDPAFIFSDVFNSSLYSFSSLLRIDFGDGLGWQVISTNSINYYTANYSGGNGNAVLKWQLIDTRNADNRKHGSAQLKVGSKTFTEPTSTFVLPGINIGVFDGCSEVSNTVDSKVLIYVEGFDAIDMIKSKNRGVSEIYDNQILSTEIGDLRRFGYDIYVVDWINSRQDIKQNGENLQGLIRWLKCNHPSEQQYVIIGESMGGLVARYALLDMERAADKSDCFLSKYHNTRLLITVDAPHKGANIPMSVQYLYKEAVGLLSPYLDLPSKSLLTAGNIGINGIAARQMLYYHASMSLPISSPQINLPDPLKKDFSMVLASMGNYPVNCKIIALSNGSMAGKNQTNDYNGIARIANDDLFSFNSTVYVNVLGLRIPIMRAALELKTNPIGTAQVFNISSNKFGIRIRLKRWGVRINTTSLSVISSNVRTVSNGDGICSRSGGVLSVPFGRNLQPNISSTVRGVQNLIGSIFPNYNTLVDNGSGNYTLKSQWTQSGWFGNNAIINSQGLHWNFVPTISALDYNTSNLSYDIESDNNNIPLYNPFSAVTGIYKGCDENGVRYNLLNVLNPQFKENRNHLSIRNDALTSDGSMNLNKSITYELDDCFNYKPVYFLNREIGDDEFWLNNFNLTYNTRYVSHLSINIEQSLYFDYNGQTSIRKRKGAFSKTHKLNIIPGVVADFNYSFTSGFFNNSILTPSQYNLYNYDGKICCESGQRLSNPNSLITDAEIINENNSMVVYPNPNNGVFNVLINSNEIGVVVISDVLGKQVYKNKVSIGLNNLSLSNLNYGFMSGIYFINLKLENSSITQKLIIN